MDRRDRKAINMANAHRGGNGNRPGPFWTDERVGVLRANSAKLSVTSIVAIIGDGCTKNMVIGKARRLGIELSGYAVERAAARSNASERQRAQYRRRIAWHKQRIAQLRERL